MLHWKKSHIHKQKEYTFLWFPNTWEIDLAIYISSPEYPGILTTSSLSLLSINNNIPGKQITQ